jgi:CheY-like chemotaxis protein/HPt (histidine-containing phosphotransfer) domain-containing protein
MSDVCPPTITQKPVGGEGDKPAPVVITKQDLKLKSCRFLLEYAFCDALQIICLAEATTASEFVSGQIRLAITEYLFRKSSVSSMRPVGMSAVLQAEHVFKPKKLAAAVQDDETSPHALNVLVVDDVLMNREIASSFLHAASHNVTCVESGAEAIDAVRSTDFDVILMDVRMPEMDGLEATRRIRALEGGRRLMPIIALTALTFPEQVRECYKAGMDSHLPKPFSPETLQAAVLRATSAQSSLSTDLCPKPAAPAASIHVIGSDLLAFNRTSFERTACHLTPETVASYLETISTQGASLLRGLEGQDALIHCGDELAEAAHAIAGSAGMLGFERLTVVGRQFERALHGAAADVPALAEGLSAALSVTLRVIEDRVPVSADVGDQNVIYPI